MKQIAFFGCIGNEAGHYWKTSGYEVQKRFGLNDSMTRFIDGVFAPVETREAGLYAVSDWQGKVLIVSWWDYSVDKRPGSNCVLIGKGYDDPEQMIDDATKMFPREMGRQKRPVKYNP